MHRADDEHPARRLRIADPDRSQRPAFDRSAGRKRLGCRGAVAQSHDERKELTEEDLSSMAAKRAIFPRVEELDMDAKRLAALGHPIRIAILDAADDDSVSPSDLAVILGEPLGVVAYHFRVLHSAGLIELADTKRRRGSIQSFYRVVRPGWRDFIGALREQVAD
ncbi:MAG TPA: helix-turn-helix domain-containing protein [Solirubrobacteraceae bacterium]|nr:helix-turn-helix domain-containing protein [Solirubrobacteraceae bacterium]